MMWVVGCKNVKVVVTGMECKAHSFSAAKTLLIVLLQDLFLNKWCDCQQNVRGHSQCVSGLVNWMAQLAQQPLQPSLSNEL